MKRVMRWAETAFEDGPPPKVLGIIYCLNLFVVVQTASMGEFGFRFWSNAVMVCWNAFVIWVLREWEVMRS